MGTRIETKERGMESRRTRDGSILAAIGLVLAACGSPERPAAVPEARGASRPVEVAEVAAEGSPGLDSVPATVHARDRATLAARIPASVVALPFREGEPVAQGDVVARLDDGALRSAVEAAESALGSAQADQRRAERLLAKNAATPREVEQATARTAAAQAAVQGARENLSYAVLRAPFAGTVAARPVDVGDVVNPGAPVIELEGAGVLELRATVDAAAAQALHVGDRVEARVDGQAAPVAATVRSLSGAGDPATHRFELRAELPAAAGLRSGLFARLQLPRAATALTVPTVPARAVFARGGLSGVFVVDGPVARLRWIAAGAQTGDRIEVRAGLHAGERVVIDPAGLEDGAPVVVR
jgi:RND family efflux transporter MFP subunit